MKVKSLSHIRLLAAPWTVAHQAPPSMRFSRQEYWSRVPSPSLEDPPEKGKASVSWAREFHGLYGPWGHKESDTTERLSRSLTQQEHHVKTGLMLPQTKELLEARRQAKSRSFPYAFRGSMAVHIP